MLWDIGQYCWYLVALVLVFDFALFLLRNLLLHEVVSPSKMFCNFGGDYFLTMLVLFWLQGTGFKWTSAKRGSCLFFGCVRGDAKGSRARGADGLPEKHPGTRCSQPPSNSQGCAAPAHLSHSLQTSFLHSWPREACLPPLPELYIL